MIDLHSHVLPEMDDGAKDQKTALAMLGLAVASGTGTIVATPHVIENAHRPAWETVVEECRKLAAASEQQGTNIRICPGAEVAMAYDSLAYLEKPGPYCINNSNYILVELPTHIIPEYTDEFFFVLQTRGFYPVLAHPERNIELSHHPERLAEWINRGILVQINGSSLMGKMGDKVRRFAELLVARNMVHCLGSDAHGFNSRRPMLDGATAKLASLAGPQKAKEITATTPGKILRGEEFIPQAISECTKKNGVFSRLFGRLL